MKTPQSKSTKLDEIDILLLRMEQTDPYGSRKKAIQALIESKVLEELRLLMQVRSLMPDYEDFTEHIKERLTELEATPKKEVRDE